MILKDVLIFEIISELLIYMTIQAVLFDKNKWTRNQAKEWLKKHNYHSISNRTTQTFYRFRIIEPNYTKYIYRIQHNPHNISFIMQYKK